MPKGAAKKVFKFCINSHGRGDSVARHYRGVAIAICVLCTINSINIITQTILLRFAITSNWWISCHIVERDCYLPKHRIENHPAPCWLFNRPSPEAIRTWHDEIIRNLDKKDKFEAFKILKAQTLKNQVEINYKRRKKKKNCNTRSTIGK